MGVCVAHALGVGVLKAVALKLPTEMQNALNQLRAARTEEVTHSPCSVLAPLLAHRSLFLAVYVIHVSICIAL